MRGKAQGADQAIKIGPESLSGASPNVPGQIAAWAQGQHHTHQMVVVK
jgi:hypothetical protein